MYDFVCFYAESHVDLGHVDLVSLQLKRSSGLCGLGARIKGMRPYACKQIFTEHSISIAVICDPTNRGMDQAHGGWG